MAASSSDSAGRFQTASGRQAATLEGENTRRARDPLVLAAKRRARTEARERQIRDLGFKDYAAYLNSPLWKNKRAAYWAREETSKTCALCGTAEPPLPLHHRTYERVGEELMADLCPVCPTCHAIVHELERRGDIDGIGADLGQLVDAERAARYRNDSALTPFQELRVRERKRLQNTKERLRAKLKVAVENQRPGTCRHLLRNLKSVERKLTDLTPEPGKVGDQKRRIRLEAEADKARREADRKKVKGKPSPLAEAAAARAKRRLARDLAA